MKKILLIIVLVCVSIRTYAQDLPQIVPLSPNASSITKYGEVPVSHFTGVPNIAIPIHTITSGHLELPLSLSYHAGGNKVESIASWVGLGWSLGSIPSISRSVRGIPDDGAGGYFLNFNPNTTTLQEIAELDSGDGRIGIFKSELFAGLTDSEPDIFYYNLPNGGGKFFYNQESMRFVTYPRSNVQILMEGYDFKVITQDGIEYVLDEVETTRVNNDQPIRNTWYASKMISPTKRDTIYFRYRDESQTTETENVVTRYHYLGGVSGQVPGDSGGSTSLNVTSAKVIDSIGFKNGWVLFNERSLEREDLQGGYGLDNIEIYNRNDTLIKKYEFVGKYVSGKGSPILGSPCRTADSYSRKWLFLDKIRQLSPTTTEVMEHQFAYDETYVPPCRTSPAQDYWGFYNGKNTNVDLTPSYFLPNVNPPAQIIAADRGIDPIKSKFGILTRITYPTKGYTEFDFENNMAYANDIQVQYEPMDSIMEAGDYIDFDLPLPETNLFTKTFTIDNPPDPILNNDNPDGGSNTRFTVGDPGCDISQYAKNCARFTVKGLTNSVPTTDIHDSNSGGGHDRALFLPNGTYELRASFNQSTPQYGGFFFMAQWDIVNITQTENKYVGGLRVKEIRSYPHALAQPITKKYRYTTEFDSITSSGDIFSTPNFSHSTEIDYINNEGVGGALISELLRVRSTSNMQQVTHSSSPVGYERVFEETNAPNETGYTEYIFSNIRDVSGDYFPYPPSSSREVYRGQLLEEKHYKRLGTGFDMVQKRDLKYSDAPFIFSSNIKYSLGMKWGNTIIAANPSGSNAIAQVLANYSVRVGWNNISQETVTTYHENDSIQKVTDYYYDNSNHLLNTRTETRNSLGELLISTTKYPQDITAPSSAVSGLIAQNRLGEVIETKGYNDRNNNGLAEAGELSATQENVYTIWAPNVILPERVSTAKQDNGLEPRIIYHGYDNRGNPLEVSKANGPSISYIWGYDGQYPVAKIENASRTLIDALPGFGIDFDTGSGGLTTAQENMLRTHSTMRDALVTTYTYDPLVGVTGITDPKGYKMTYHYDDFNRLEFIRDEDNNLVTDYEYHYRGQ